MPDFARVTLSDSKPSEQAAASGRLDPMTSPAIQAASATAESAAVEVERAVEAVTRIQVRTAGHPDEQRIVAAAAELGVAGLRGCRRWTVYHLEGLLSAADTARLCRDLLVDPVTDEAFVGEPAVDGPVVEVAPIAGVTDPEARELERAAATLGLAPLRAATARRYELSGDIDDADIDVLTRRLLANATIEQTGRGTLRPAFSPVSAAQVRAVRLDG